jgi:hypothetical protein
VENIINEISPSLVFHDSQEIYSPKVSKKKSIECIGYITNNMYTTEYLNTDKRKLYSLFLNIRDHKK